MQNQESTTSSTEDVFTFVNDVLAATRRADVLDGRDTSFEKYGILVQTLIEIIDGQNKVRKMYKFAFERMKDDCCLPKCQSDFHRKK